MLKLELAQDPLTLVPGQVISGRFGWEEQEAPKWAALNLTWYTEGRGTQDVGVVAEKQVAEPEALHDEEFTMAIPNSPYSFTGKLITLKWALELVLNDGETFERIDLMVLPWTEQVKLTAVE